MGDLPSLGRVQISIDTRGQSGYVVAPGSSIDGRSYLTVIDTDEALIDLDDLWALRATAGRPTPARPRRWL